MSQDHEQRASGQWSSRAEPGGKHNLGGITKRGDTYLRSLLIQGAKSAVMSAHKRSDPISVWVSALKERFEWQKAAVALANKNARILWAVMTKGDSYEVKHVSVKPGVAAPQSPEFAAAQQIPNPFRSRHQPEDEMTGQTSSRQALLTLRRSTHRCPRDWDGDPAEPRLQQSTSGPAYQAESSTTAPSIKAVFTEAVCFLVHTLQRHRLNFYQTQNQTESVMKTNS